MTVLTLERPTEATATNQLTLEGFPEPKGNLFSLASTKNIPTDKELGFEQAVSGTFEGTVAGVYLIRRGGEFVKVYQITVLEATLD